MNCSFDIFDKVIEITAVLELVNSSGHCQKGRESQGID